MNKQKKIQYSIVWLLATYVAMHLFFTGHFSLTFDPGQLSQTLCSAAALWVVTAAPEDSLGDGPGDR